MATGFTIITAPAMDTGHRLLRAEDHRHHRRREEDRLRPQDTEDPLLHPRTEDRLHLLRDTEDQLHRRRVEGHRHRNTAGQAIVPADQTSGIALRTTAIQAWIGVAANAGSDILPDLKNLDSRLLHAEGSWEEIIPPNGKWDNIPSDSYPLGIVGRRRLAISTKI